jgi:hypothetical protein
LVGRQAQSILEEIETSLSHLQPDGRRFFVARMGSTGSSWLAKLLNSHPDVFCSHEGVAARAYPARSYGHADILRFLNWLAWDSMHGAYTAIGDVGSVWSLHAVALREFQTAILLRHPARLLNTRLARYAHDQSFTEVRTDAEVREIWDIDMSMCDPLDRVFLHDLFVFASQAWAAERGVHLIRIEDMSDSAYCLRELKHLTGMDYDPGLVGQAIRKRVNQHVQPMAIAQIVASFTPRQREWYWLMLREAAPHLGYDLGDDISSAAASV